MKKNDVIENITGIRGKITWVVGDEVAYMDLQSGMYRIFNIKEEPGWKVTIEATPSFQSSLAQMSDEQLRESIIKMRQTRAPLPKSTRNKVEVESNDPVSQALVALNPEQREKLMKKLGMI